MSAHESLTAVTKPSSKFTGNLKLTMVVVVLGLLPSVMMVLMTLAATG